MRGGYFLIWDYCNVFDTIFELPDQENLSDILVYLNPDIII